MAPTLMVSPRLNLASTRLNRRLVPENASDRSRLSLLLPVGYCLLIICSTYPISSQRTGSTSHILQPLAGTFEKAWSFRLLAIPNLARLSQASSPRSLRVLPVGRKRTMRAVMLSTMEMLKHVFALSDEAYWACKNGGINRAVGGLSILYRSFVDERSSVWIWISGAGVDGLCHRAWNRASASIYHRQLSCQVVGIIAVH